MESLGYTFFEVFMQWVSDLKWVLIAFFVALVVKRILGFRPEERLMTVLMFSYFFLVITSFWILKPIKKVVLVGFYNQSHFDLLGWSLAGPQVEQLAKVLNMVVAFIAAAVFSYLSRSLRRQQLTYSFSAFFIICYLLFALLLDTPGGLTAWVLLHVRRSVQHSHGCHILRISQRQRHLRGGKTSVWPHRPRCSSRGGFRQYHGRNLRS